MPSQQRMKKNNSEELASQAKKCRKIDSFFNKTVVHNQPTTPAIAKSEKTDSDKNPSNLQHLGQSEVLSPNKSIASTSSSVKPVELYRGYPYDIKEIQRREGSDILCVYQDRQTNRSRHMVKCLMCNKYEEEAKKHSKNNYVYIAHGVRCDSKEKLERIIDHLLGNAHKASCERKSLEEKWEKQSSNHPWINVIKNINQKDIDSLIKMFYHIYNDAKVLTLSANSYPSRSLTEMAAQNLINSINSDGFDTEFTPFEPSINQLHYQSPQMYKKMLTYIGDAEMLKLKEEIESCLCLSVQQDGSVDKKQRDNKYVTIR